MVTPISTIHIHSFRQHVIIYYSTTLHYPLSIYFDLHSDINNLVHSYVYLLTFIIAAVSSSFVAQLHQPWHFYLHLAIPFHSYTSSFPLPCLFNRRTYTYNTIPSLSISYDAILSLKPSFHNHQKLSVEYSCFLQNTFNESKCQIMKLKQSIQNHSQCN